MNYANMTNDQLTGALETLRYLLTITPPEPCEGQAVYRQMIQQIQTAQTARAGS